MMRLLLFLMLLAFAAAPLAAAPTVVKEWTFDTAGDVEGWGKANHMANVRAADGLLQGDLTDWDPFIVSPQFEIPATPWQAVEIRLKTDCGGGGEVFWTNTTESEYNGFSPGKETPFEIIGDNQWHEYRIQPYWQGEKKIILLRLDLARAAGGGKSFALDWIRIVDLGAGAASTATSWDLTKGQQGWTSQGEGQLTAGAKGLEFESRGGNFQLLSPPLQTQLAGKYNVHLRLEATGAESAALVWATHQQSGLKQVAIPLRKNATVYNLDLSGNGGWDAEALLLGLWLPQGAKGTLSQVAITQDPVGPAEVEAESLVVGSALPRVGQTIPLLLTLHNHGGEPAQEYKLWQVALPPGLKLAGQKGWELVPEVSPLESVTMTVPVRAEKPVQGKIGLRAFSLDDQTRSSSGQPLVVSSTDTAPDKAPAGMVWTDITVTASLNLPKATYVPEPKPVRTDYQIGAYYFPGWDTAAKWHPIRRVAPERKPVLGWYDESNPEIADWQIKWAVEHGINFFMLDWYWSAGGRHLEHWLHNAYMKAKYRSYLKWCMMWANHNAPNTHSEADQRAVTKYWIDNYFGMKEYYRINDMPVVMIWAPGNIRRDMGGSEGAKKLLDLSQEMAKAAGYKGIYFMAMAGPDAQSIQTLKDEGYSMTSSYHYMDHRGKAADPRHYAFDLVANSSYDHWQDYVKADVLPFLPNLATGWDDRPWHGDRGISIRGRTVPLFRKICEDAKRFADEQGIKLLSLAPLNEWGEGSYLEPCTEFGFEMYDQVREVFCDDKSAPHLDFGPADVGLGPYDYPDMDVPQRTAWDFDQDRQGWGALMGMGPVEAKDGVLTFVTASKDPALMLNFPNLITARKYKRLLVRIKVEAPQAAANDQLQLFWSADGSMTEAASVKMPLIIDGQWHEYALDLAASPRWRGNVRAFRFDVGSTQDAKLAIDWMKLD